MINFVKVLKFDEPVEVNGHDCIYLYKEKESRLPLENSKMLFSYMTNTGFRASGLLELQVDITSIETSDVDFWDSVATQLSLPSHTFISQEEFQTEITPSESSEEKLNKLREVRNLKIEETDFYALSDVTMSDEMQTYRQALRDITNTYSSLDEVVWPTKPV